MRILFTFPYVLIWVAVAIAVLAGFWYFVTRILLRNRFLRQLKHKRFFAAAVFLIGFMFKAANESGNTVIKQLLYYIPGIIWEISAYAFFIFAAILVFPYSEEKKPENNTENILK